MQVANAKPASIEPFAARILDALQSSIIYLDREGRILHVNAAAESLFENSAGSLVGRPFTDLLSKAEPSTILDKLGKSSSLTEHAAVITLANGKSVVADYSISAFDEESAKSETLIEIQQHERQSQIAREELSHLQQQATQRLARGLAHEINNPLGGIRGAAQLLQRELDRPDWIEYTEVIISEVDRLQGLINNMLVPGSKLQRKPVNIYEVLEHICKIIHAAEPGRIVLERDYDPSIPPMLADRDLLIQAFLNIARNAVQAIEGNGTVTFKTRVGRYYTIGQVTHPLVVRIDISDTGRGIPRDLQQNIFLPMITDKPEGSGLGLPIAQEIIFRHGGTIQLQSSDAGTTFSTILPLEQP